MADFQYQDLGKDYLEHYGVLGMKWGVRRYQNADGTLTKAGKKRQEKERKKDLKQLRKLDKEASRSILKVRELKQKSRNEGIESIKALLVSRSDYAEKNPAIKKRLEKQSDEWMEKSKATNKMADDYAKKAWKDQDDVIQYLRKMTGKYGDTALASTDPRIISIGERYVRTFVEGPNGEMYLTSTDPTVYEKSFKKK